MPDTVECICMLPLEEQLAVLNRKRQTIHQKWPHRSESKVGDFVYEIYLYTSRKGPAQFGPITNMIRRQCDIAGIFEQAKISDLKFEDIRSIALEDWGLEGEWFKTVLTIYVCKNDDEFPEGSLEALGARKRNRKNVAEEEIYGLLERTLNCYGVKE